MAVPVLVGAGTGASAATGTFTVSKTGCINGNLIIIHIAERGNGDDAIGPASVVNVEKPDGTDNLFEVMVSGQGTTGILNALFVGRAMADGTVSGDFTVGASGDDLFARIYEFSGEAGGTTLADVFENPLGTGVFDFNSATGTSITDIGVQTNGTDRLALNFVALSSNQACTDFTGETGGDWAEAFEYQDATGTTCTLQLQTATMPSAGTIDGGNFTITSAAWAAIGMAIIPVAAEKQSFYISRRRSWR